MEFPARGVAEAEPRVDAGFTHVALAVQNVDRSIDFYRRFARMELVHHRRDDATGTRVVWLSDRTRPFVLVLIETQQVEHVLGGTFCHLGVACSARQEVERLVTEARLMGYETTGPHDSGPPVGYWAYIVDPDGHNLELSYGQFVGSTVASSASGGASPAAT
ncbi:MAG: hypothetical protein KatS3mg077_2759 [Candidatus Binatia bacterium]|nr:MAG: hypothetical protein KatS3mg077_2759 [Candidatus Binatia bacterium]